ncbi:LicD family protein [bacterium]|nr:LicD family protein [bacterium]
MINIIKKLFNNIFSIQDYNKTHILIKFIGIKFKFLKYKFNLAKKQSPYYTYKKLYNDITKVPPADGELRQIQLANLVLLDELDYVCRTNNIPYWLDGGTLLGAVRHKGFIPWDDDVDVDMMRDDYEKFPSIFNACTTNPDLYCELWRDKNAPATCILKIKHRKIKQAFIDIFPHDFYYTRARGKDKIKLNKKVRRLRKSLSLSLFRIKDNEKLTAKIKHLTNDVINEKIEVDERLKPSIHWGLDFPHRWNNWIYDYDQIFPLRKIEFEGYLFNCPADTDFMLRNIYGDYMKFPKSICPHHTDENQFTPDEINEIKKLI